MKSWTPDLSPNAPTTDLRRRLSKHCESQQQKQNPTQTAPEHCFNPRKAIEWSWKERHRQEDKTSATEWRGKDWHQQEGLYSTTKTLTPTSRNRRSTTRNRSPITHTTIGRLWGTCHWLRRKQMKQTQVRNYFKTDIMTRIGRMPLQYVFAF